MIQMGTILEVADNSGARKIACIRDARRLGRPVRAASATSSPPRSRSARRTRRSSRSTASGSCGGHRPHARRAPPQGRLVHPLRRQRGRPDLQRGRADRHARLRARGPRAAREEVHEDHFARTGSALMTKTDRPKLKLRKNDMVVVIAGQGPRHARARSCASCPATGRVIVERVNMIKRHTRPNPGKNIAGGISEREAAIHISNVMLVDPDRNVRTRIGRSGTPRATRSASPRRAARCCRKRAGRGTDDEMTARLKDKYAKEVAPALTEGVRDRQRHGDARASRRSSSTWASGRPSPNPKMLDGAAEELSSIAGQKRRRSRRRRSRSRTFKLRTGMPIGARVTLRGDRMWEFLDRLINIALPRVRDFRGVSAQGVRRPRQLHARRARPLHLPGDRLREDGQVEGLERDDRDDGGTGRPGARRCCAELGMPFAK